MVAVRNLTLVIDPNAIPRAELRMLVLLFRNYAASACGVYRVSDEKISEHVPASNDSSH
jgi:hypothetical protein